MNYCAIKFCKRCLTSFDCVIEKKYENSFFNIEKIRIRLVGILG